jgi:hypothetical protein
MIGIAGVWVGGPSEWLSQEGTLCGNNVSEIRQSVVSRSQRNRHRLEP